MNIKTVKVPLKFGLTFLSAYECFIYVYLHFSLEEKKITFDKFTFSIDSNVFVGVIV